ncbi:MAG: peptidoglycan-binding domain-containing protein [Stellaceae bacterium]
MKNLILAAVSALALGVAGIGIGPAQAANATPPSSSATMHSRQTAQAPTTHSKTQLMNAQRKLKTAGLYNGAINGRMNSATRTALAKFQKKHNLRQTGALDQQTMAALNHTTSGSGSSLAVHTRSSNAGTSGSFSLKPHTRTSNTGNANAGSSGAEHQGSSASGRSITSR